MNNMSKTATFIMPHWRDGSELSKRHLDETISSIKNQTDEGWQLVIVDDASPSESARKYLNKIKDSLSGKVHIIRCSQNRGAGSARNVGVEWAYKNGSPFVLFCDADDVMSSNRLECVRDVFSRSPTASVVYHPFTIIDENSSNVPEESVTPNIMETIATLKSEPPQGRNVWVAIGTKTGYINLTSATSVVTDLAYRYPFPDERISEDSNTWMRYAAAGDDFVFEDKAQIFYRIPQGTAGSASRSREGGKDSFYAGKVRVDQDGFIRAMEIAVTRETIDLAERDTFMIGFYLKLGETVYNEDQVTLAQDQLAKAIRISPEITRELVKKNGHDYWAKIN